MNVTLLLPAMAVVLLFSHCNNADKSAGAKMADSSTVLKKEETIPAGGQTANDTTGLQEALVRMYLWHEALNEKEPDFSPAKSAVSDTAYSGVDPEMHRHKLRVLTGCGFFSPVFIANYDSVAARMNKELHEGIREWLVGDISPYYEASPWCNCQDYPTDDYLHHIKLTDVSFNQGEVSFAWVWGADVTDSWSDFKYHVRAVKESGRWLFTYLEGFDAAVLFAKQAGE